MSKYLKFVIENTEPVRIANDETSQHGQTDTLRYIPGSTIRGLAVNLLVGEDADFEQYKTKLFSDHIRFLNAYLTVEGKEMIPSLKGFYEDKKENTEKKQIENVVMEDITPGNKRAYMGQCCFFEDDCIYCTEVKVGEDLNINIGRNSKKAVFRSQYISKNQKFTGFITFDDEIEDDLISLIKKVFAGTFYLGNRRSAGYGACQCCEMELRDGVPYADFRKGKAKKEFFMALLSNTVMVNEYGEMTGLYLPDIAECLGCERVEIIRCAASVLDVRGYNRSWKGMIPSAQMYEAGSVFHLRASQEIPEERFRILEKEGLGIRKNEGFGQIAILDAYDKIKYKKILNCVENDRNAAGFNDVRKEEIHGDLCIAAKGLLQHRLERYMEKYIAEAAVGNDSIVGKLKRISGSKRGIAESLCISLQYLPEEAEETLRKYLLHEEMKRDKEKRQDGKEKMDYLQKYIEGILDGDLFEILEMKWKDKKISGISISELMTKEEEIKYKLKLIISLLRFVNREEKNYDR